MDERTERMGDGASFLVARAGVGHHGPTGVSAQQMLFIGVSSLGDGGVDPLFESHHVFVAAGFKVR